MNLLWCSRDHEYNSTEGLRAASCHADCTHSHEHDLRPSPQELTLTGGREYWPMNEIRQVSRKAGEHKTEDEGGGGPEEASLTAGKRRQWTLLRFGAAHQHSGETAVPNSTVWLGMLVFWCDLLLAHVPAGGYFLPSHLQR